MPADTSTGPHDASPQKGDKADQAVIDGVDAQEESDREMQRRTPDGAPSPRKFASPKPPGPDGGLAHTPSGAPPQAGQQGAGADRDKTGES